MRLEQVDDHRCRLMRARAALQTEPDQIHAKQRLAALQHPAREHRLIADGDAGRVHPHLGAPHPVRA